MRTTPCVTYLLDGREALVAWAGLAWRDGVKQGRAHAEEWTGNASGGVRRAVVRGAQRARGQEGDQRPPGPRRRPQVERGARDGRHPARARGRRSEQGAEPLLPEV